MNASTFLRLAAIITLLYSGGHTAGMPWTPASGPEQTPMLEAMKTQTFIAQGATRTYWDFYFGFGVMISVFLLAQAIVLWQLGGVVKTGAQHIRAIIASFLVAFLANAILAWMYFFAVPALMAGAIVICLVIAFVLAGRPQNAQPGVP